MWSARQSQHKTPIKLDKWLLQTWVCPALAGGFSVLGERDPRWNGSSEPGKKNPEKWVPKMRGAQKFVRIVEHFTYRKGPASRYSSRIASAKYPRPTGPVHFRWPTCNKSEENIPSTHQTSHIWLESLVKQTRFSSVINKGNFKKDKFRWILFIISVSGHRFGPSEIPATNFDLNFENKKFRKKNLRKKFEN